MLVLKCTWYKCLRPSEVLLNFSRDIYWVYILWKNWNAWKQTSTSACESYFALNHRLEESAAFSITQHGWPIYNSKICELNKEEWGERVENRKGEERGKEWEKWRVGECRGGLVDSLWRGKMEEGWRGKKEGYLWMEREGEERKWRVDWKVKGMAKERIKCGTDVQEREEGRYG